MVDGSDAWKAQKDGAPDERGSKRKAVIISVFPQATSDILFITTIWSEFQ